MCVSHLTNSFPPLDREQNVTGPSEAPRPVPGAEPMQIDMKQSKQVFKTMALLTDLFLHNFSCTAG